MDIVEGVDTKNGEFVVEVERDRWWGKGDIHDRGRESDCAGVGLLRVQVTGRVYVRDVVQ